MQSMPITINFEFESRSGDTTLCDKVHQLLVTGWWFSQETQATYLDLSFH
jgi:hypothetical protein